LEPTNEAYALAKISGLKLIEAYRKQYGHKWISAMPTNLYGPGDNFDKESSHVLPALIRKFDDAIRADNETVTLWGSGLPLREFLYVDDLASACLHLLSNYDEDLPLNVGTGEEVSIARLAELVARTVGFVGQIIWDSTKPDGTPRKLLDTQLIGKQGWSPKTLLADGIARTFVWYSQTRHGTMSSQLHNNVSSLPSSEPHFL
jgi:GDP-L-fucose synthase